jgi:hypothetical protein
MKIAYFTDTFMPEVNGVTNTLSSLLEYLEKQDIQCAFFAPKYPRKPERPEGPGQKRIHRFMGITTAFSPESSMAFPPGRRNSAILRQLST